MYNFENSSPGVSKTTKYGSPLITCKNCRKEFWDTGIVEIAVSGINKDDTRKIRIKTVISALTAMVCVIVMGLLIGKTDYAQNIIVIRTLAASANAAGEAIDNMRWPEILGTISGDNTIFVVVRNEAEVDAVVERFREILK